MVFFKGLVFWEKCDDRRWLRYISPPLLFYSFVSLYLGHVFSFTEISSYPETYNWNSIFCGFHFLLFDDDGSETPFLVKCNFVLLLVEIWKFFFPQKLQQLKKLQKILCSARFLLLFCWGLGSPNRFIHVAVCADPFLRKLKMVTKGEFQGRMVFCNFWGNQVWSLGWGRNYFLKFTAWKCFHCTEQWKA